MLALHSPLLMPWEDNSVSGLSFPFCLVYQEGAAVYLDGDFVIGVLLLLGQEV